MQCTLQHAYTKRSLRKLSVFSPKWSGGLICVLLTLFAAFAMFNPCLSGQIWPTLLLTQDYYQYHGPQAFYMDASIHEGEFPLWNPLTFCGQPFAHNPQVSLFYPPNLLRSLLTFCPTPAKTHLGLLALVVAHMIIAGLGIYLLSRDYGLSGAGAATAVLAFVFGPAFVQRALLQWVLVAAASWLPWQIFFVRRMLHAQGARSKTLYALLGAVALALNVLAGFPQLTFYAVLIMFVFAIAESVADVHQFTMSSLLTAGRNTVKTAGFGFLMFAAAGSLAACILLPGKQFIESGGRARGQGHTVEAAPQDLSLPHVARSLLVYPGATAAEPGCRGAGLGVLALALAAFSHRRRRDVIIYGVLFYIMVDCTLGPPFPFGRVVARLDLFQFSSPWRACILQGLPLAMLAGFGLDAATVPLKNRKWIAFRSVMLLVAGTASAWVVYEWLNGKPHCSAPKAVVWIPLTATIVAAAAGLVQVPRVTRPLLVILVFAELVMWNHTYIPGLITKNSFKGDLAFIEDRPRLWDDNYRGAEPSANMNFYRLCPAINGYDPLRIERVRSFLCDRNRESGYFRRLKDWEVTSENQRGNLFLKRSFWLARQYVRGPLPNKSTLFPSATTVFFPEEVPDTSLPEVERRDLPLHPVSTDVRKIPLGARDELARLAKGVPHNRIRITLPEFTLGRAHGALCLRYRSETSSHLAVAFADPANQSLQHGKHVRMRPTGQTSRTLEIPLPAFESVHASVTFVRPDKGAAPVIEEAWVLTDNADEDKMIRILERRRNSVEVQLTDLPEERILLFLDAWYPGWSATVDGEPVSIYLADDVFKAILVGKGTHKVRFTFSGRTVYTGVAISLVTSIIVLAAIAWLRQLRT